MDAEDGSTAPSFVHVPPSAAFEPTTRNPNLPCHKLGTYERLETFIGRADILDAIDACLLPVAQDGIGEISKSLRSFALCGLGGLGKTQTAVEFMHTRKRHFEAVFWLIADNPDILAQDFARIAQHLGIDDPDDGGDLTAGRELVKGWLSNPVRKLDEPPSAANTVNWLIIFDNVSDLDVLSDYWPTTGHGSVLVTSRDPLAKLDSYTVKQGLDLPPLSSDDTKRMLEKLIRMKTDDSQQEALSSVVSKLGGLPLAISSMAGVIRESRMTFTNFLKFWEKDGIIQLEKMQLSSSKTEQATSLATVWALDQLPEKTTALLQVLSLLDPDCIPETILLDHLDKCHVEDFPQSTAEYYQARASLLQSSLIVQNADVEQLSLHRLTQETVRASMAPARLITIARGALDMVVLTWPFQKATDYHSTARFKKCELILPCVLRIKAWIENLVTEKGVNPGIEFARLLNDTGW